MFIINICFTIKVDSIYGAGPDTRNPCHKFNSQGPALRILDLRVSIPKPQRPSCRVLGVRASCPRVPVPRSWVSGFQSPESQGLTVPQSRVSGFQGLRVLVSNLRVKDPGSQVLILDCAFTYIYIFTCYLSGPSI